MLLGRTGIRVLVLTVVAVPALTACGGESEPEVSAADLLQRASSTLAEADSVHFVLDSSGAPAGGTVLIGGEGDIVRPASFQGTLQVLAMGVTLDMPVVAVDGTVYAQLPFTSGYEVIDPQEYGVGDPGDLLDPEVGIVRLLEGAEDAELGEERRVDGEVVRDVTASIPGDLVERVLDTEDPGRPVEARLSIDPDSGELRRAELVGPFFSAEDEATYILELTDYGADVEITAPPTG